MSVLAHLNALLENEIGADVTVAAAACAGGIEERRFHSIVLLRVPYFEAMLASSFQEALTKRVHIDDVPSRLFFPLLKALYSDELENADTFELSDLVDMLGMCRRFQFPPLFTKMLVDVAQSRLCWGANITETLARAEACDLADLRQACVDKVEATLQEARKELAYPSGAPCASFLRARMAVTGAMLGKLKERGPEWMSLVEAYTVSQIGDIALGMPRVLALIPVDIVQSHSRKHQELMMFVMHEKQRTTEMMLAMMDKTAANPEVAAAWETPARKHPWHEDHMSATVRSEQSQGREFIAAAVPGLLEF
eukprot:TRINITY_DN73647_c0_g1_i2.p1 TRINITY_DN73647_c0_g1~~TRINITY_DN73647_c0_g1_i2.p1  ORF type:complete len:309 (+),score=59.41 TRINITY_DN73647_c0_g1_i2:53-979(+)